MKLTDKQKSEGWIITKFGDIAEQISKRVNPVAADSSNYIGLEHLDSDSLRVSRWGTEIVLKGQKLAMKKGDILFAKRNAYLRRVAIAPIDGIFSAHGMILRPKGDLAISGFLPFFMQSDMFMERAVAISEGSLSPTIKWKTLANQEFPLPPRPRQEEIVALFFSLDKSFECNLEIYRSAFQTKISVMSYQIHHARYLREVKLGDVAECLNNKRIPLNDAQRSKKQGEYHYWGANGIVDHIDEYIFEEDAVLLAEDGGYFDEFFRRPIANIARGKYWVNNHAHILKPKSTITLDFLYFTLVHKNITGFVNPGTRAKLNQKDMLKIPIKLPDIETQNVISKSLNTLTNIEAKAQEKAERIVNIKKLAFHTFFAGEKL